MAAAAARTIASSTLPTRKSKSRGPDPKLWYPDPSQIRESSKKSKDMKTNIMIFRLSISIIAIIIQCLVVIGYWKIGSELDSIKMNLIKIKNNLPTTTTTATTSSTITSTKTATATSIKTTATTPTCTGCEIGECGPIWTKWCCNDHEDDALKWLKCVESRDNEIEDAKRVELKKKIEKKRSRALLGTIGTIGGILVLAMCCASCDAIAKYNFYKEETKTSKYINNIYQLKQAKNSHTEAWTTFWVPPV